MTTVTYTIEIAAPPSAVFHALTSTAGLQAWLADEAEVDLDGDLFAFWGRRAPGNPGHDEGRHAILNLELNRLLAFEWDILGQPSSVEFELAPTENGTTLNLRHDGLPDDKDGAHGYAGFWGNALQNLRGWVERGAIGWQPDYSATQPTRELRVSVQASVSPEVAFRALTEPAQLERWMMAENARVELTPGGVYDLGWAADGRPVKVLEVDPDRRLSLAWEDKGIAGTVATWSLEGSDGGTRITLVHSGFGETGAGQDYYLGWGDFLTRLKFFAEQPETWRAPSFTLTGLPE